MTLTNFWAGIERQLDQLSTATTAQQVIDIIGPVPGVGTGDAFFEGGGGDTLPDTPLALAGWTYAWSKASYYWAMVAPDGTSITYIEGDIYLGNREPAR